MLGTNGDEAGASLDYNINRRGAHRKPGLRLDPAMQAKTELAADAKQHWFALFGRPLSWDNCAGRQQGSIIGGDTCQLHQVVQRQVPLVGGRLFSAPYKYECHDCGPAGVLVLLLK